MPTNRDPAECKAESLRLYKLCSSTNPAQREAGYADLKDRLLRRAQKMASRYGIVGHGYLAEECCASAMIRIYEHLPQLREAESFLFWCAQTLHREYLSLLEREGLYDGRRSGTHSPPGSRAPNARPANAESIEAERPGEGESPLQERIRDMSTDVEQEVSDRDWIRHIVGRLRASRHMSEPSKYVLILGYFCDRDDDALAEDLGKTRKNITVIRARDMTSVRRNEPELVAEIRRRKL
jgi:DNA-directed RNA polymerase specialized sigma24 family protein